MRKQILLVWLPRLQKKINFGICHSWYIMFRRGADFVNCALDMIVANERVNGEFYTCPVYNYMIAKGAKIGTYQIKHHEMHGIGTPEDLAKYLSSNNLPISKDIPK